MNETAASPPLAKYRDAIMELIREGEPFGDVEDAINAHAGLTGEHKAALWLFAFSMRDRSEQQRDALAHLTAVQGAAGDGEMTDQARERELGEAAEAALRE